MERYDSWAFSSPTDGGNAFPPSLASISITDTPPSPPQETLTDFISLVTMMGHLPASPLHRESQLRSAGYPIGSGASFRVRSVPALLIGRTGRESVVLTTNVIGQGDLVIEKQAKVHVDECGVVSDSKHLSMVALESRILGHDPLRRHRNIIDFLGLWWWESEGAEGGVDDSFDSPIGRAQFSPVIGLEFAQHGTLSSFSQRLPPLSTDVKVGLSLDVARGIDALHACGIVHGDIKSENILVCTDETAPMSSRKVIAKLADFGLSVILGETAEASRLPGSTTPWNAPERFRLLPPRELQATDVYSFAFTIWRLMIDDENPFADFVEFIPGTFKATCTSRGVMAGDDLVELCKDDPTDVFLESARAWVAAKTPHAMGEEAARLLSQVFGHSLLHDGGERSLAGVISALTDYSWQSPTRVALAGVSLQLKSEAVAMPSHDKSKIAIPFDFLQSNRPEFRSAILTALERIASDDPSTNRRANACLQLSICHCIPFGLYFPNGTGSLDWAVRAARLGLASAQAIVARLHRAYGIPVPDELRIDVVKWLAEGTKTGSWVAAQDLAREDPDLYRVCRDEFLTEFGGIGYRCFSVEVVRQMRLFDSSLALCGSPRPQSLPMGLKAADVLNEWGHTVFHCAATCGLRNLVEYLLDHDASLHDINVATSPWGETAILCACRSGRFEVVEYLCSRGADAGIVASTGASCLHWLISFDMGEMEEVANLLVENGAVVDAPCRDQGDTGAFYPHYINGLAEGTPLHWAVLRNDGVAVETLMSLKPPANPYAPGFHPGNAFYGLQADPTRGVGSPVEWACRSENLQVLRILLDKTGGEGVNCSGPVTRKHIALQMAGVPVGLEEFETWPRWKQLPVLAKGCKRILQTAWSRGKRPMPAIRAEIGASTFGLKHMVSLLGFLMLSEGQTTISLFSRTLRHAEHRKTNLLSCMAYLVGKGSNVYQLHTYGLTALECAVEGNDSLALECILELRLYFSLNHYGPTYGTLPMQVAIAMNNRWMFELLVKHGAIATTDRVSGPGPFHLLRYCGLWDASTYFTRRLLEMDGRMLSAEPNARQAAFYFALETKSFKLADLLMEHGEEIGEELTCIQDIVPHSSLLACALETTIHEGAFTLSRLKYLLEPRPAATADRDRPRLGFILRRDLGLTVLHLIFRRNFLDPDDPHNEPDAEHSWLHPTLAYLLSQFPDALNSKTIRGGHTPLHHAVDYQHEAAVALLLRQPGIDVNAMSNFMGRAIHHTPLDLALSRLAGGPSDTVMQRGKKAQRKYFDRAQRIVQLLLDAREEEGSAAKAEVASALRRHDWERYDWRTKVVCWFLSWEYRPWDTDRRRGAVDGTGILVSRIRAWWFGERRLSVDDLECEL